MKKVYQEYPPIINPNELLQLHLAEELIIVDASAGKDAKENYAKRHLAGALHVDLDTQLADIKPDVSIGGRHPLPSLEKFSETLTNLGITPTSHVIIYDDKNGANAASRFWWMLKSVGHKKAQVLNGGLEAAIKAGLPVNSNTENPVKTQPYECNEWLLPQADLMEVDIASVDKDFLIIDVRDEDRYNGEKEPIDLIAGHIPNAINIPLTTNLNADGLYLPPNELKNKYQEVLKNRKSENVIVHCGSGVTACHTLLALAYAGLEIPKLYVGSWSEWSKNNRPMATKLMDKK